MSMGKCIRCGSHAINHGLHGRDGSDPDLCDVCYWRKRAESCADVKPEKMAAFDAVVEILQGSHVDVSNEMDAFHKIKKYEWRIMMHNSTDIAEGLINLGRKRIDSAIKTD